MNGATADPCVSTIKPPNSRSTTTIGSSQNFFRSRMNAQSSRTNSPIFNSPSLELPGHVGAGSGGLEDAIRRRDGIEASMHRISPEPPHDDAHRRRDAVEDHGEENARVDPSQRLADRHPDPMHSGQAAR